MVDFACLRTRHYSAMMLTILRLLLLIPTALRLRSELAIENPYGQKSQATCNGFKAFWSGDGFH
jgi:hypothetical protein